MKGLWEVAKRELVGHWTWLSLIVVVGLLPLLGSRVGLPDRESQGMVALALALVLMIISTLVLGASILGRDMVTGRLGFFLSRPIPWWGIWSGKLLAAFVLAVASMLAFAPAGIALWGTLKLTHNAADAAGAVQIASWAVIGLGVGQWLLLAFASRSAWLVLDLACLGTMAWSAGRWANRWLLAQFSMAMNASPSVLTVLVGSVAVVVLCASAAPYALGRVSLRRCHAAASLTLWGGLALWLGGVSVYAARPVSPKDLRVVFNAVAAPEGSWIAAIGGVGHVRRPSSMLVDTAGGRYLAARTDGDLSFSADGTAAAWLQWAGPARRPDAILYARLTTAEPRPTRLTIEPPAPSWMSRYPWSVLVLSPSGNRLLVTRPDALDVYSMPGGARVATIGLAGPTVQQQVFFLDEDHVRAYVQRQNEGPTEIAEAALSDPQVTRTGQLAESGKPWVRLSADGERALVWDWSLGRIRLQDGRDGRLLATLLDGEKKLVGQAAFLAGGRVAVVQVENREAILRVLAPSGQPEQTIDLGPGVQPLIGGEPAAGQVFVGLRLGEVVLVDWAKGVVARRESGLRPINCRLRGREDAAGGVGARLFIDSEGRLVRLDPESGRREVLIGKKG
jgi:hypothetical protein